VNPGFLLHLAWAASGTPDYRASPDNERWVRASMELWEACQGRNTRLVMTGTALDTMRTPSDAYSASKVQLRRLLRRSIEDGQLTWLRPYYVFDPERGRPALVREAVTAASAGRALTLRTPFDRHDFVHAADVARAALLAIGAQLAGDVPVGSGRLRRVSDLVEALGASWLPAHAPPGGAPHTHEPADIHRLAGHGWSATHTEELFAGD
jgi:nucleoside-diphosphate-sugar epimerase